MYCFICRFLIFSCYLLLYLHILAGHAGGAVCAAAAWVRRGRGGGSSYQKPLAPASTYCRWKPFETQADTIQHVLGFLLSRMNLPPCVSRKGLRTQVEAAQLKGKLLVRLYPLPQAIILVFGRKSDPTRVSGSPSVKGFRTRYIFWGLRMGSKNGV